MAERHQLKIADRHGISADDPFAELTRIMGFDPREPVKPQAVMPGQPAPEEGQGEFDIDLEKELMGEFATYDELVQQAAAPVAEDQPEAALRQPAQQPAQEHAVLDADMDDAVAASLDHDFMAGEELDRDFAAGDELEPESPAIEPEALADEAEALADETEALASEPDVLAVEPEAHVDRQDDADDLNMKPEDADEVARALQGTWFSPAEDDVAEMVETETAEPVEVDVAEPVEAEVAKAAEEEDFAVDAPTAAQAYDDDQAFDAAVSADLDDGLSMTDEVAPVEASEHEAVPAYDHVATQGDFAPEAETGAFEETVLEEDTATYQEAAPYHEPLDEPEAPSAYRQPAQTASTSDLDDFDAHFDSAMADVDMDFTARPQPQALEASEADELAADMLEADETVDDECVPDAGMDMDAAFDDAFAVEPAAAAPEPVAMATAEPAAPRESTLEDELNALLAKMTTRPAVSVASAWPMATPVARQQESAPVAPAPQPAAEHGEDDLAAALVADLHAMDLDDADLPGEDIDFDTEAFHAALTEADEDNEPAPAAAPAPAASWFTPKPAASPVQPAPARATSHHHAAPEVETIDVPERVVALADDLDIPEVPFEEPQAGNKLYDDLENEFAGLLGQMEAVAPAHTHAAYNDDAYGAGLHRGAVQPQTGAAAFQQPATQASAFHPAAGGLDADNLPGGMPPADPFAVDELAYDPDDAPALADPAQAEAARRPQRRGVLIAGIVCAVAVAGGLGALAMSFGGKGSADAPALVKADDAPIKVKPENPGGTVIPNQDNKVYEAVAKGIKPAAPEQQKLVTSNEEPVDVNAAAPQSRVVDLSADKPADATAPKPTADAQAAQPAPKSEDRVEQTAQADASADDVPVVTPRKVRTMVVKPDGSLVAREDPAPTVAATEPADPAPQHVVTDDQTGAVPPKADAADATTAEPALKPAKGEVASTPKTAPIAPQRPSDQPVDVVGEVKADKVASIDTTASTAGSWSMQIASQPTAESAQSTYQDLARRYAGVLEGHGVNIVKADIAGKGTFYRVRVPTGSRNDAIKLCESYKAAGGNCFVSK